jgi:small subunit ribosomal protein S8
MYNGIFIISKAIFVDLFDMLTRLRNSVMVKARSVNVIYTKLNYRIAEILKEEDFIESFDYEGKHYPMQDGCCVPQYIKIMLKYKGVKQIPYITEIKRISKPGLRVYVSYRKIPKILGDMGLAVFAI